MPTFPNTVSHTLPYLPQLLTTPQPPIPLHPLSTTAAHPLSTSHTPPPSPPATYNVSPSLPTSHMPPSPPQPPTASPPAKHTPSHQPPTLPWPVTPSLPQLPTPYLQWLPTPLYNGYTPPPPTTLHLLLHSPDPSTQMSITIITHVVTTMYLWKLFKHPVSVDDPKSTVKPLYYHLHPNLS